MANIDQSILESFHDDLAPDGRVTVPPTYPEISSELTSATEGTILKRFSIMFSCVLNYITYNPNPTQNVNQFNAAQFITIPFDPVWS